jgi:peptidoglycan/LPS O-acetylase OafA/YrhL
MGCVSSQSFADRRIRYIDGLRAVAVLAVVSFHAANYRDKDLVQLLPRVVMQGHHGVELFFVLSGFCLSYPMLTKIYQHGRVSFDIAAYAAKRVTRIIPLFYLAIGVFAVIGAQKASAPDIIRQALFIDSGTHLLNSSFWSLPVEFRWYFAFPLVLLLWVRSKRTFASLIAGLFVLQQTRAASTDIVALPAFMLGIVAADLAVQNPKYAKYALALFLAVSIGAFGHASLLDRGQEASALWEIAVFLLVVAGGATPWLTRALSLGVMVFLGRASYSIYLFHELGIFYAQQRGYVPWVAGVAGVALGIAFWYCAERVLTSARVRSAMIPPLTQVLRRCCRITGVPANIELAGSVGILTSAMSQLANGTRLRPGPKENYGLAVERP